MTTSAETTTTQTADQTKTTDHTQTTDQTKTVDLAAQAAADAAAAEAAKKAAQTTDQTKTTGTTKETVYTLSLPKDAVIEASAVERVTAFAKAHSLTPAAAQEALNHADAEVKADRTRQQKANAEAFKKMAFEDWPAQIKAHPKYGGTHYTETLLNVKRLADVVIAPYPERVEALNKTGWGNQPILVEIFADIGARMANDTLVVGAGGGAESKSAAELLYGGTKQA